MLQKWERQPDRVGLLLGFVSVPLGWWLQSRLLYLALGYGSPSPRDFIAFYCIWGAIPGAICGRGFSQAIFAWRQGNWRQAKGNLVWHSAIAFGFCALFIGYRVWFILQMRGLKLSGPFANASVPLWLNLSLRLAFTELPFQIALLLLFIGLMMRSRSPNAAPLRL